jgi:hypothetical protein
MQTTTRFKAAFPAVVLSRLERARARGRLGLNKRDVSTSFVCKSPDIVQTS